MLRCPQCRSPEIHQSRRKGLLANRLLSLLFVRPFRCERCDCRFFRFSFSANRHSSRAATTN